MKRDPGSRNRDPAQYPGARQAVLRTPLRERHVLVVCGGVRERDVAAGPGLPCPASWPAPRRFFTGPTSARRRRRQDDPLILDRALLQSQAFHIDFVMAVAGLVTMIVWGSLTPDRRDALVLGTAADHLARAGARPPAGVVEVLRHVHRRRLGAGGDRLQLRVGGRRKHHRAPGARGWAHRGRGARRRIGVLPVAQHSAGARGDVRPASDPLRDAAAADCGAARASSRRSPHPKASRARCWPTAPTPAPV